MSTTTWKQLIYDCADAIRSISESTAKIAVGSIPDKIVESAEESMIPTLTETQKNEIKELMTEYFNNKSKFVYGGNARRQSYAHPNSVSSLTDAINGCIYNDKFILNCGVFAQMIWMGRSLSDFNLSSPSTKINTDFDWGYYFDFNPARRAYGVTRANGEKYTANTYKGEDGQLYFITFDNAAAMAQELYQKGYEIPYSKVDIGDLVFYRSSHISDETKDGLEQSSFRYITHVGIVYNITEYSPTILECTDVYTAGMGRAGLGDDTSLFGNLRAAGQDNRVVMAARHPAAWGKAGNVPNNFEDYRGVDVQNG